VIFTSGSTGKPKGVAIEHLSVVNTLLDINARYGIGCSDRVLAVSALSFDLSVYDLFGMLAAGGAVVFPSDALAKNPGHWLEMLDAYQVTVWNTVPVSAGLLTDQAEALPRRRRLKVVMMSGDWVDPKLPARLWRQFEGCTAYSLGGATEGAIWSIHYPILHDTSHLQSVPYGQPLSGQSFYVLNESLQVCPQGVTGELCIGGIGVAREYYGDPELTARQFVWHPGLRQRLYRTGDLGRYMSDGNIEFKGRVDNQLKLHGYRIELGEIEQCIKQWPGVDQAVVAVKETVAGDAALVAYLVLGGAPDENARLALLADLKEGMRAALPQYMVPQAYLILEAMPVTANGKVDRKQLPAPPSAGAVRAYVPPLTPAEVALSAIWQTLFNKDQIGRDNDFFELGGHSLLATRMVAMISHRLGVNIPLSAVFSRPVLSDLATLIGAAGPRAPAVNSELVLTLGGGQHARNIFFVNPGAGTAHCYRALAEVLGDSFNCFGLNSPLIFEPALWPDFGTLVQRYVDQVLALQPDGEYCLAGYSSGGVIAYEMACQLQRAGARVRLVLFDSFATTREYRYAGQFWFEPVQTALTNILELELAFDWASIAAMAVDDGLAMLADHVRAAHAGHFIAQLDPGQLLRYLRHFQVLEDLKGRHTISRARVDCLFYKAGQTQELERQYSAQLDWDRYNLAPIDKVTLDVSHRSMMNSTALAHDLRRRLLVVAEPAIAP
jgi:thioesterase domain-containing protein/acyl carrier protein